MTAWLIHTHTHTYINSRRAVASRLAATCVSCVRVEALERVASSIASDATTLSIPSLI